MDVEVALSRVKSLRDELAALPDFDIRAFGRLADRALVIATECFGPRNDTYYRLTNILIPDVDPKDPVFGSADHRARWQTFKREVAHIIALLEEPLLLMERSPNRQRLVDIIHEVDCLRPKDRPYGRRLKNKAEHLARTIFGDDSQHIIDIRNVDFTPPSGAYMIDPDEHEVASAEKFKENVEEFAVALQSMLDDPNFDAPQTRSNQKSTSTPYNPSSVNVQGDHNTVIVQSPGASIAPAPLDLKALQEAVAGSREASDELNALLAELKKSTKQARWANIASIVGQIIRFAPAAARVLGPWLGHPDTMHYAEALPTDTIT